MNLKKKNKKGEAVGSRVIVNKHPTSTPSHWIMGVSSVYYLPKALPEM
jgi:hypothetical protein